LHARWRESPAALVQQYAEIEIRQQIGNSASSGRGRLVGIFKLEWHDYARIGGFG